MFDVAWCDVVWCGIVVWCGVLSVRLVFCILISCCSSAIIFVPYKQILPSYHPPLLPSFLPSFYSMFAPSHSILLFFPPPPPPPLLPLQSLSLFIPLQFLPISSTFYRYFDVHGAQRNGESLSAMNGQPTRKASYK